MTPKSTLNLLNLDNVLRAKEKEKKRLKVDELTKMGKRKEQT